jgi:hypothetical protein
MTEISEKYIGFIKDINHLLTNSAIMSGILVVFDIQSFDDEMASSYSIPNSLNLT